LKGRTMGKKEAPKPFNESNLSRRRAERRQAAIDAVEAARSPDARGGPMVEVVDPSRIVTRRVRPVGVPPWIPEAEWDTWTPDAEAPGVAACWSGHKPLENSKRPIARTY
jgi:hypothetical protein